MPEELRIGFGVLGGLAIIAVGIGLTVYERRQLAALEAAWRSFVQSRGFGFAPHQGLFWLHPGLGATSRVWGVVDGVSSVVELAGWKRIDSTKVLLANAPLPSSTKSVSELWPDSLDPDAARALAALRQLRQDARIVRWPCGGHFALAVGWRGLERDPVALDRAIALMAALGRRAPVPRRAGSQPA